MSVFESVTLNWKGKDYVIPGDRVMGAIYRAEEHYTFHQLTTDRASRKTVRVSALAQAYGSVLRYAGADASDEDVYVAMFKESGDTTARIMDAVIALQAIMMPPETVAAKTESTGKKTPKSESSGKPSS